MSDPIELTLEVFDAIEPLQAGDLVVTSSVSVTFPQGLPVGEVTADVDLEGTAISAPVRLFAQTDTLRIVVVITWPPEPGTVEDTHDYDRHSRHFDGRHRPG